MNIPLTNDINITLSVNQTLDDILDIDFTVDSFMYTRLESLEIQI